MAKKQTRGEDVGAIEELLLEYNFKISTLQEALLYPPFLPLPFQGESARWGSLSIISVRNIAGVAEDINGLKRSQRSANKEPEISSGGR